MPMRHGQRKHLIHSLNSLLYQLHTVSFLLSPRLWPLLLRISTQSQFTRPRSIDSQRSLRFWFILVLVVHAQSLIQHILFGGAEERSIILDFVGIGYKPSKALLVSLDLSIIFLEFILVTIAYETSLALVAAPNTPDPLQTEPTPATPTSPYPPDGSNNKPFNTTTPESDPEYVIDLRLRTLISRLRHPPSPPPPQQPSLSDDLLPLPNTTHFQLSRSLSMLARAGARLRERTARAEDARANRPLNEGRRDQAAREEPRRVPGAIDDTEEL